MRKTLTHPAAGLVALLLLSCPLLTQDTLLAQDTAAAADSDKAEIKGDYGSSFLRDFERASDKLLQLAEAIPADKYSWSPTPEVRSVSKVFIHVALANSFLSNRAADIQPPEGLGRDAEEKITEKADVIAALKASQENVRKAVAARKGDFEEEVELFWGPAPVRDIFLQMAAHSHEHMGQMIAYARMAGITPPWSQDGGP